MVISGQREVLLGANNFGPGSGCGGKGENFRDAFVALAATVENDLLRGDKGSVMGNVARSGPSRFNGLPLNVVVGVILELLHSSEVNAPHGGHLALFDVSSSVNVEVLDSLGVGGSKYERAVV